MKNKKLRNGSHSRACSHAQEKFPAVHDLLSSRLYCRPRNFTESCLAARGLYHRWGIAPRPEDPDSIKRIIGPSFRLVKSGNGLSEKRRECGRTREPPAKGRFPRGQRGPGNQRSSKRSLRGEVAGTSPRRLFERRSSGRMCIEADSGQAPTSTNPLCGHILPQYRIPAIQKPK